MSFHKKFHSTFTTDFIKQHLVFCFLRICFLPDLFRQCIGQIGYSRTGTNFIDRIIQLLIFNLPVTLHNSFRIIQIYFCQTKYRIVGRLILGIPVDGYGKFTNPISAILHFQAGSVSIDIAGHTIIPVFKFITRIVIPFELVRYADRQSVVAQEHIHQFPARAYIGINNAVQVNLPFASILAINRGNNKFFIRISPCTYRITTRFFDVKQITVALILHFRNTIVIP